MPVVRGGSNKAFVLLTLASPLSPSTAAPHSVTSRVPPALLCRVEHQCQKLSGCSGCPAGAAHSRAPRGAAAVPGCPKPPGGSHPVHRSAEGMSVFKAHVHINVKHIVQFSYLFFLPTERHMQRIGRLLQASMFLNYMWHKMRVAGAPSRWGRGLLGKRFILPTV